MAKYRKKPVVIEAVQWLSFASTPMKHVREGFVSDGPCTECGLALRHIHGWVGTLEGGHRVCPGDWIITGVAGEQYPCKPDIFAETYGPAGDTRA